MPAITESKYLVMAGWDDAPHLTDKAKRDLLRSTPPHLRDARSKGIPALGSGAIFPLDEEMIKCDPIQIPDYWPRINGIDFGWTHPTAVAGCAWDRDNDIFYVYNGIKRSGTEGEALPPVVAASVKMWGEWIPTSWPHDGNKHELTGKKVAGMFKKAGLKMLKNMATHDEGGNDVEAGLLEMLERMQTGRFKVFSTVSVFFEEFRLYHRKNGKIVKEFDDFISAVRYALMMKRYAKTKPVTKRPKGDGWKPLDPTMGY